LVRADADTNRSARGAYVLHEASGGERQLTLLATGSEVALAVRAREQLQAQGVPTAVVSMPCWELFNAQDTAWREQVLGPRATRLGIEAALRFGWDQYLGLDGGFIGMTGFGASGPADQLYQRYGITVEAIVALGLQQAAASRT
jgi:transketolase